MRIIARPALIAFYTAHPDAKGQVEAWYREALSAVWNTPADIKERYGTASILKDSRVVFNLCGNSYRLVVKIAYPAGIVYIRFIGTHAQYDAIDAEEI